MFHHQQASTAFSIFRPALIPGIKLYSSSFQSNKDSPWARAEVRPHATPTRALAPPLEIDRTLPELVGMSAPSARSWASHSSARNPLIAIRAPRVPFVSAIPNPVRDTRSP